MSIFVSINTIYSLLDRFFILSTNGSQLKKILKKSDSGGFSHIFISNKEAFSYCFYFIILFLIYIINLSLVFNFFSNNYFTVTIFSFKLDFVYLFGTKYKYLKSIYAISSLIVVFEITKWLYSNIKTKIFEKIWNINESTSGKEIACINLAGVEVPISSLYENLLITGSIGTGKTSGVIMPVTKQLIKQNICGIILDAKANIALTLEKACTSAGRLNDLQIISENSDSYFEILDSTISPIEMANRIRRVIELISENNISDSYFLDKVENTLLNIIMLMDYYMNGKRDMLELHKLVISKKYLLDKLKLCKEKILQEIPDTETSFNLTNVLSFFQNEYLNLDERNYSIITSEITRITIPCVTDYKIYNQFFKRGRKRNINFSSNIVVLSINIGKNKLLCKIIGSFLKLSFQKWVLSNFSRRQSVFFICDEFQEFVNKEDAAYFSLSREAKCINIISTQSYSSLKNTLNSDNNVSVILQNFVNKIWFRNEDNYTISETIKQLRKGINSERKYICI